MQVHVCLNVVVYERKVWHRESICKVPHFRWHCILLSMCLVTCTVLLHGIVSLNSSLSNCSYQNQNNDSCSTFHYSSHAHYLWNFISSERQKRKQATAFLTLWRLKTTSGCTAPLTSKVAFYIFIQQM